MSKLAVPGFSAFFLVLFGCTIMYSSLYSVNRSITNQSGERLSAQQWYRSSAILPDHPLYLGFMAKDRAVLLLTPQNNQPELRFAYAEKRFNSAVQLAEKGEIPLAVTTLSKSQQYILAAAKQARIQNFHSDSPGEVAQELDESIYKVTMLMEKYPEVRTPHLEALVGACKTELSLIQQTASKQNAAEVL